MNLPRIRLVSILLTCFGGFTAVGFLLDRVLRGRLVLAAMTLGLVLV